MRVIVTTSCDEPGELLSVLRALDDTGREFTTRVATEPEELHVQGAMLIEERPR